MSSRAFVEPKKKNSTAFSPILGKKSGQTFNPKSANGGHDITNQRFGHDFSRVSVHTVAPMMIQTKLIIGRPGDKYEQEAERVASYVVDKTSFAPKLSVRERSAHPIQRQETKKPPTEEEKYKEAAKKAAEAFLETPVGKRITDKAKELGEDFVSTLPGKVVTGAAAAGAVATIVAKNAELPIQPPAIPLDKVAPGLSMKITYKGPVLNPTAASIAFTYKFGGAKKSSKKPAKTESRRIREETARLARELHEFRESMKTPEQKAEDEASMQWYILHRTSDPTSPLYIPGLVPKKEAPKLEEKKREEETLLQRKEANLRETATGVPSIVHDVLRSPGQPLDSAIRTFMESRFGHDFSRVRVHTDAEAAKSARAFNALAYTIGQEVFFGTGQFAPGMANGKQLLAHELAHVVQQSSIAGRTQSSGIPLSPEVLHERPLNLSGILVYRKPETSSPSATQACQQVVVIVGRPSGTLPKNETPEEKEQMMAWRAAAGALATIVFEGLTVDTAFAGMKKLKAPISRLYIICHADQAGIGEVDPQGRSVSTTVADLTKRMKAATGVLSGGAPESVEILACFGGGSPKTMGRIGEALGASKVRAPVQTTVISGIIIKIQSGNKTIRLTRTKIRKMNKATLMDYIKQTDALKYYDFVPGVPHPLPAPSKEDKLTALVIVLRKTGMISYVSYNKEPGKRDAVPYWKAKVEKRKATEEEIPLSESLATKGVIEVTVPAKEENP